MSAVTEQIPEEALALAGLDAQSASEQASRLVAMELFREGRASLGRTAELAGMPLGKSMEFSALREIPLHYTPSYLKDDRLTAERLGL